MQKISLNNIINFVKKIENNDSVKFVIKFRVKPP